MAADRFQQRLRESLQHLQDAHLLRERRTVTRTSSTTAVVDGVPCVTFSTNDYLGLCHHPDVLSAFQMAAVEQSGSGASPLIAGRGIHQERLEGALAQFEHSEVALVFPSGFAANVGVLTSLAGPRDAVFCERDNHASLIDGCRASGASFLVYDRHEPDQLRKSLQRRRQEYQQVFLVSDSVFSMDGTVACLSELCDLADEFDASVVVDEAHGTGVFGQRGSGVCELQQVEHRVAVRVGTLSKAIGCVGGFVVGTNELIQFLWNKARTQFFSTALPPAVFAAATESIRIIAQDAERRIRLHQRAMFLRCRLETAGLNLVTAPRSHLGLDGYAFGTLTESPIIAVLLDSEVAAVEAGQELLRRGFHVPAVRPPTVPSGTSRLRLSVTSEHSEEQIVALCEVLESILSA
ncbi:MAG: 8-amino-7-oxononanoate synthase [Planctomycetaceae bacterium]|nr:8-amino-7-oxononanoate synthase [Planctomycetaceae bacterium]